MQNLKLPVTSYILRIFKDTFHNSEAESLLYLQKQRGRPANHVMLTCMTVAFSLTLIHYFSDVGFTGSFLHQLGAHQVAGAFLKLMYSGEHSQLMRLVWWAATIIFFYLIVP